MPSVQSTHYHSLDSLRFVAASVVLLAHTQSLLSVEALRLHWALKGLSDGKAAVCFFFVLSGFVLHLSIGEQRLNLRSYFAFIMRRLFRIYPLYYVSLALCWLAVSLVHSGPQPVFPGDAAGAPLVLAADHHSLWQWIHQVLLVSPGFDMHFLNPPTWTLAAEMRVALIFPVLALWFRRRRFWGGFVLLLLLFPACHALAWATVRTFQFIPLFALGIFLAQHRMRLGNPNAWLSLPMLMLALTLYGSTGYARTLGVSIAMSYYLSGIGSGLLIWLTLASPRFVRVLECSVLRSLGRVSYGIYILHFGVLLALAGGRACLPDIHPAVWGLLALALTMILAYAGYHMVEARCIRLGRRAALKINPV